jgi:hypothetical protein
LELDFRINYRAQDQVGAVYHGTGVWLRAEIAQISLATESM